MGAWGVFTNPFLAWRVHFTVLWVGHVPVLLATVLENELVHALQHLSFLVSALLFW